SGRGSEPCSANSPSRGRSSLTGAKPPPTTGLRNFAGDAESSRLKASACTATATPGPSGRLSMVTQNGTPKQRWATPARPFIRLTRKGRRWSARHWRSMRTKSSPSLQQAPNLSRKNRPRRRRRPVPNLSLQVPPSPKPSYSVLVPRSATTARRTGMLSIGLPSLQIRELLAPQAELNRPTRARDALNEPTLLQRDDHGVDRRGRHPEAALHVGFSGRDAVEFGVVMDERQVLALRFCKGAFHVGIVDARGLLVNGSGRVKRCCCRPSPIAYSPHWHLGQAHETDLPPKHAEPNKLAWNHRRRWAAVSDKRRRPIAQHHTTNKAQAQGGRYRGASRRPGIRLRRHHRPLHRPGPRSGAALPQPGRVARKPAAGRCQIGADRGGQESLRDSQGSSCL